MEFDFDKFRENPSLTQVDACRVVDLMLIANWLGVEVPQAPRKMELKELVVTALQEKVLVGATGVQEEEEPSGVTSPVLPPMARVRTTIPTDPANITGMSAEELRLTFRIREMEAMHLNVKLLELERQPRMPPQSPDRTSPRCICPTI